MWSFESIKVLLTIRFHCAAVHVVYSCNSPVRTFIDCLRLCQPNSFLLFRVWTTVSLCSEAHIWGTMCSAITKKLHCIAQYACGNYDKCIYSSYSELLCSIQQYAVTRTLTPFLCMSHSHSFFPRIQYK